MTPPDSDLPKTPLAKAQVSEIKDTILRDVVPLGILTYSKQGHVLDANRCLLDLLGSPSVEATKQINLFAHEVPGTPGYPTCLRKLYRPANLNRYSSSSRLNGVRPQA